jgi:hypothetical protein
MPKTKVLVSPLCGSERDRWLNPSLVVSLLTMTHDPRFGVIIEPAYALYPVDYARNVCVASAREQQVDWLIQVDNDQTLPVSPLDIIAECGPEQDVIGLSAGIRKGDDGRSFQFNTHNLSAPGIVDGKFLGVLHVGSGVLILRNSVWRTLPRGPWFRTIQRDDELRSVEKSGGEDWSFCDLARAAGLKLWTHRACSGHLKTTNLTALAA